MSHAVSSRRCRSVSAVTATLLVLLCLLREPGEQESSFCWAWHPLPVATGIRSSSRTTVIGARGPSRELSMFGAAPQPQETTGTSTSTDTDTDTDGNGTTGMERTGTQLFRPTSLSDIPLRKDELEWIRNGLVQAAEAAHAYEEEQEQDASNYRTGTKRPAVVGPTNVLIYDTTLRDGTQGEAVSASAADKLKITRRLAAFDVDYIEAGWPGSNPKDADFFARAKTDLTPLERAKLVAFGSTRRKNTSVLHDKQVQALLFSEAPTICIVAKSHSWQVTEILKAELDENIRMITDTVSHLVSEGRRVMVDMEHFFDGYQADPSYALLCCEAAADAGAICLVLCDTNGGSMPWNVATVCQNVVRHFDGHVTIGVHCHNDCGMAVANSVVACQNGVGLIQGTINGIGERTGNADLCSIVPALALHVQTKLKCRNQISEITQLSRFVDETLNRTPSLSAPFVGASAFAHKGGLHVAAMERSPLSYQHIDPELVGNEKRVLISELSGRQNIIGKIREANADMNADVVGDRATAILNHVKQLESKGYTFEGAEASVDLMILHSTVGYCPPFQVLDYTANVYDSHIDSASRVLAQNEPTLSSRSSRKDLYEKPATARATVNVRTVRHPQEDDPEDALFYQDTLEVSDGNGPVDALTRALMKALLPSYPSLRSVELADYKVRILDPEAATKAVTRVLIEFRDTEKDTTWTTVSVDSNVISASLNALIDGFEYALVDETHLCILD